MAQQRCPEVERLQDIIRRYRDGESFDSETMEEIVNALTWLKDWLLTRRNYQRKTQLKRRLMTKMLSEQGLGEQLDELIKRQYGEELERFDDVQEDD